jgi:hypothetical protein
MGLKEWWEDRQTRKREQENQHLLELAEHPQQSALDDGTEDLDEIKTDLGTSKMGERSMDDARRIE